MGRAFGPWFAPGLLAVVALLAACGGSTAPPATPADQGAPVGSGSAATAKPPAAELEPTATPAPASPFDLSQITPVPPPEWPPNADELPDPPDHLAARLIEAELASQGFDLGGLDLYVIPLPDGGGNMLVFDADSNALAAGPDGESNVPDLEAMALPLIDSEAYEAADIARIVFNVRILDEQGQAAYILIITQPADIFAQVSQGLITDAEAQQETRLEIREVGAE